MQKFSKQTIAEERRYEKEHGFTVDEAYRRTRLWTKSSTRTMQHSVSHQYLRPDGKLNKELGKLVFTSTGQVMKKRDVRKVKAELEMKELKEKKVLPTIK